MKTKRKSKKIKSKKPKSRIIKTQPSKVVKAPSFVINPEPKERPVSKEQINKVEPLKFVIDSKSKVGLTKVKSEIEQQEKLQSLAELTPQDKLQMFVDLACYRPVDDLGFVYIDVSNAENQARAEKWFNDNLTFLGKRDAEELRRIWNCAIEDGGWTRMLFNAIILLKDKYAC